MSKFEDKCDKEWAEFVAHGKDNDAYTPEGEHGLCKYERAGWCENPKCLKDHKHCSAFIDTGNRHSGGCEVEL